MKSQFLEGELKPLIRPENLVWVAICWLKLTCKPAKGFLRADCTISPTRFALLVKPVSDLITKAAVAHNVQAQTIVQLYLHRWEVATFRGWFKRHLVFQHWYSLRCNGVLIQIWAGLLTFVVLKYYLLVSQKAEFSALRLTNLRWLRRHLLEQADELEVVRYTLFSLKPATAPPVNF